MKRISVEAFAGLGAFLLLLVGGSFLSQGCGDKAATAPVTVTQGVTLIATPPPDTVAGSDWNYATLSAGFPIRNKMGYAVFNNRMWFIGGYWAASFNDVWSSADGSVWTQVLADTASPSSTQFTRRSAAVVLVYNNKLWIIGGWDNTLTRTNEVWSSPDGSTWTHVLANNASPGPSQFPQSAIFSGVVYNNKMWVIGGGGGNAVWSSSDGVSWTQVLADNASPGSSQFPQRNDQASLVFNNKMWVLGGSVGGTTYRNDVWSSTDGATWTQVLANTASPGSNQFSQRSGFQSLVYGNAMWVMSGTNGPGTFRDVWYSVDGSSWTQITASAAFPGRFDFGGLVFNNAMWVFSGTNGSVGLNDVWYSPF